MEKIYDNIHMKKIIEINPKIIFVGHDKEFEMTDNTKTNLLEINY